MSNKASRFLRDRRGITPVLSNILLLVVAVAVMAVTTSATYMITTNLRENMSERVIVEDLWFNNQTGNISVYLRNVGKVSIHVSGVYVNHTSQSFNAPFDLQIGQHGWLNIPYAWVSDALYYVDVVTNRGTHVAGYYEAP